MKIKNGVSLLPLDILRKQDDNRSIHILQGLSTKKS